MLWALPFFTLCVVIGLPVVIIAGLIYWGIRYKIER